MYDFVPPNTTKSEEISVAALKREEQINELEALFKHLQLHRELPAESKDSERYSAVSTIRELMLQHYEEDEIDWELVHDAGCTCDNSELPQHVSTKAELEVMFESFKHFLEALPSVPTIITISRSTDDDYTPASDVDIIQETVLKLLSARFTCDAPIMAYLTNDSDSGGD